MALGTSDILGSGGWARRDNKSAEFQCIRHTPCAAFLRRHTECAGYDSSNLLSRSGLDCGARVALGPSDMPQLRCRKTAGTHVNSILNRGPQEKGDRHRLPERPGGCCAQNGACPLFPLLSGWAPLGPWRGRGSPNATPAQRQRATRKSLGLRPAPTRGQRNKNATTKSPFLSK